MQNKPIFHIFIFITMNIDIMHSSIEKKHYLQDSSFNESNCVSYLQYSSLNKLNYTHSSLFTKMHKVNQILSNNICNENLTNQISLNKNNQIQDILNNNYNTDHDITINKNDIKEPPQKNILSNIFSNTQINNYTRDDSLLFKNSVYDTYQRPINIPYKAHEIFLQNINNSQKHNTLIKIIEKRNTRILNTAFNYLVLYNEKKKNQKAIELIEKDNQNIISGLKNNIDKTNNIITESHKEIENLTKARKNLQEQNNTNIQSLEKQIENLTEDKKNLQEQNNKYETKIKQLQQKNKQSAAAIINCLIYKTDTNQIKDSFNRIKNKSETESKNNIFNNLKTLKENNDGLNFLKYIPFTKERKNLKKNNYEINNLQETLLKKIEKDIPQKNSIFSMFKNNDSILNKLKLVYKSLSFIEKTAVIATNSTVIAVIMCLIWDKIKSTSADFISWGKLPLFGGSIGGFLGACQLFVNNDQKNAPGKTILLTACSQCGESTNLNRTYCYSCGQKDDTI